MRLNDPLGEFVLCSSTGNEGEKKNLNMKTAVSQQVSDSKKKKKKKRHLFFHFSPSENETVGGHGRTSNK